MKVAAIDLGTNSMRLLIADYADGKFYSRKKYINTTRIGQEVDKTGNINREAMNRNIIALKKFKKKCEQENCKHLFCIGTSAIRDSKNSRDFIDEIKKKIDINLEVLSGDEEANLGLEGVVSGLNYNKDILVIDIGGGSTEFVIGGINGIKYKKSINIGALRLTERFLSKDPIDKDEYDLLEEFVYSKLSDKLNFIKKRDINKVVGIGGTITSISAIKQKLEIYIPEKIHASKICKKDVEQILQMIKNLSLNDKKELPGLQKKRADIITAGVGLLNIIMNKLEIKEITVSEYDNLEGLLCHKLKKL